MFLSRQSPTFQIRFTCHVFYHRLGNMIYYLQIQLSVNSSSYWKKYIEQGLPVRSYKKRKSTLPLLTWSWGVSGKLKFTWREMSQNKVWSESLRWRDVAMNSTGLKVRNPHLIMCESEWQSVYIHRESFYGSVNIWFGKEKESAVVLRDAFRLPLSNTFGASSYLYGNWVLQPFSMTVPLSRCRFRRLIKYFQMRKRGIWVCMALRSPFLGLFR